jgi:hypothetical protein
MAFRCDISECHGNGEGYIRCEHKAEYVVLLDDEHAKVCKRHKIMFTSEAKVLRRI